MTWSDTVALTLAVDYVGVGKQIRAGEATSKDYFTLVSMNNIGEI